MAVTCNNFGRADWWCSLTVTARSSTHSATDTTMNTLSQGQKITLRFQGRGTGKRQLSIVDFAPWGTCSAPWWIDARRWVYSVQIFLLPFENRSGLKTVLESSNFNCTIFNFTVAVSRTALSATKPFCLC
jgi:hypothetical protein